MDEGPGVARATVDDVTEVSLHVDLMVIKIGTGTSFYKENDRNAL